MYPDFQYLLQELTGSDMPGWLSIFKVFGFFVALAFIGGAITLGKELKRKEQQGLLVPTFHDIEIGKPASPSEIVWSAVIGFLLGFKIGGFFFMWEEIAPNPIGYIFSGSGSWIIGIAGGILMAYSKYAEKKKEQLPAPKTKKVATYPHQRITEIVFIAAIAGLAGAKIFNALETWEDFLQNPVENLISSSGLTFYGGLIVAALSLYWYARKHKMPFHHLCDAVAPGLMLAYGIGRLGCHFAGDGDWGIFNSAYITEPDGTLRLANDINSYMAVIKSDVNYMHSLAREFGSLQNIPHIYAPAPGWLPDWMYAMNYPHNVNNEGVQIANCFGPYCSVLPVGVFPTPMYEAVVCILLFLFLWGIRKKIRYPLHLFGIYLILNGVERFFVEKIRVNYKYDWGFIHPTQAEIISVLLVLTGVSILLFYRKKEKVPHLKED